MPKVHSAAELTAALSQAKPHDVIELAIGEYGGAFIIDRPLTLRGQRRQSVLWRQAAPIIYVRAPEVHLERLLIERTAQDGVTVIHDVHCRPSGADSVQVDENTLINLGELLPGAEVNLPLRLTVQAQAELSVTGLHGARLEPSALPARGTYRVTLILDGRALERGEVLLGEIAVREGEQTRSLWLTGTVLEQPLPEQQLCLAIKKHRLYPPLRGMLLSAAHFAALGALTCPKAIIASCKASRAARCSSSCLMCRPCRSN
jgi:hypothetical protein